MGLTDIFKPRSALQKAAIVPKATMPTKQLASVRYTPQIQSLQRSFNAPSALGGAGTASAAGSGTATALGTIAKVSAGALALLSLDFLFNPVGKGVADATAVGKGQPDPRKNGTLAGLQPGATAQVSAPVYPFTGGQSAGVAYRATGTCTWQQQSYNYGKYAVGGVAHWATQGTVSGPVASVSINQGVEGAVPTVTFSFADGRSPQTLSIYTSLFPPSASSAVFYFRSSPISNNQDSASNFSVGSLVRNDRQTDTGGNPPPTQQATFSIAPGIQFNLQPAPFVSNAFPSAPLALQLPTASAQQLPGATGIQPSIAPVSRLPGLRPLPAAQGTGVQQADPAPSPSAQVVPQTNPASRSFWSPTPSTVIPSTGITPGQLAPVLPTPAQVTQSTGVTAAPTTATTTTGTSSSTNPSSSSSPVLLPMPATGAPIVTTPGQVQTPSPSPVQAPAQIAPPLDPLSGDFNKWWNTVGLVTIGTTLSPVFNPQVQQAIATAAQQGACQSLNGGCTTGVNINQQVTNAANNSNAANALLQGADLALLGVIDSKLGSQIPNGGIGGFLQRAFQATRLDKILNALTFILALHNAAMLSRSLGATLGDLTSQALTTIGIKDENGSPLDINAEIGRQVNNLMSTILGVETWAGTKTAWNKANSILSSANQIMWTVRSLFDSGREVTEWIANNTGKIGNALKRFRVVGEDAYPHMAENVTHQNAWMLKVQRYREGVDTLDDTASSLQGVLGEVQNIQQEAQELNEQKQRFDNAIKDAQPKTIPDNNPVKDKADATKIASASPATQADVFRGEGENNNA